MMNEHTKAVHDEWAHKNSKYTLSEII
jgi:hypothetical protein